MNYVRQGIHQVRDQIVRTAALRAFEPIESPEQRIVLVRPDHFGDLLFLTPVMSWLRDLHLPVEFVLMAGPWNRRIAEHIGLFSNIIDYPFPGFVRNQNRSTIANAFEPYRQISDAAEHLREERPRAAILLRDDHWWGAWMTREAGIPLRFGYDNPQVAPFLSHPIPAPHAHYVEQNFRMVERTLTALGFPVQIPAASRTEYPLFWPRNENAVKNVEEVLAVAKVHGRFFVVHPGTGADVKRWPVHHWADTIMRIHDLTGMPAILTGSDDDSPMTATIASLVKCPVIDLADRTTLIELGELFRRAKLVLGVDSGPLHLATAVGTRSIHLYGPSDTVRFGPWGAQTRHRVVRAGISCPRCGDLSVGRPEGCGCMMAIETDHVVNEAIEVLSDVD